MLTQSMLKKLFCRFSSTGLGRAARGTERRRGALARVEQLEQRLVLSGLTFTTFTAGITPNSFPLAMTGGPDGNVWFTEGSSGVQGGASRVAKVTPNGTITEFSAGISTGSTLLGITSG